MSFSDFLVTTGYNNQRNPPTGSSQLNSGLSNPLTSSAQSRILNPGGESEARTKGQFFVSSSVSGGMYVNIPSTNSVSLRIWGRLPSSNQVLNGVALLAKNNTERTGLGWHQEYNYSAYSGYEFGIHGQSGESNNIRAYVNFGGYKTLRTGNYGLYHNPVINLAPNTWIGLRMDIVPVNANTILNGIPSVQAVKDIITCYTASLSAPDTWIEVYKTELSKTDNRFIPWGSYTTTNFQDGGWGGKNLVVATSSYGFAASCGNNTVDQVYFDDFKMFVE